MIKKLNFIVLLIILTIAVSGYELNKKVNAPNGNPFGDKNFVIESGQGVTTIAENLKSNGFLETPFLFKLYVWMKGAESSFVDGDFNLRTDMSIVELINQLHEQQQNKEVTITITEGMSIEDIDEYLAEKIGVLKKNEFIAYCAKYDLKQHLFLIDRPKGKNLEGYLYPDTYRIYKQTTVAEIVEKMLSNFDAKLTDDLRAEIKRQKKTLNEVLTLASIVEKEMYGYENRRVVAGLFQNRLDISMPLQSDATVNFITHKGMERPTLADTKIDNPYNTYKYYGLPPAPICNPSIEAIKATIYQKENDYLYFITTPDNEIIYAKTYEAHLRNVQKYLN